MISSRTLKPGRRVVLVMADGSLAGTVDKATRTHVELSDPTYLPHENAKLGSRQVDGQALVPWESVEWVQVV